MVETDTSCSSKKELPGPNGFYRTEKEFLT
jgi:hypothetical protein